VAERRPGRAIADGVVEPPADADPRELAPEVRAELRSLAPPVAERVARHLVATAQLLDEDPDAALAQARAARAFGARLGSVREAAGVAAYRAGEWVEAIAELRTARRLTGDASHLPLIADSERALGRPERALTLARSAEATALPAPLRAEMRIVESGARRDLGQLDAGLVALEGPDLDRSVVRPWSARLRYAYADLLLALGREQAAREWFVAAAAVDTDGATDAAERLLDLDGFTLDVADDADDYEDEDPDVATEDLAEDDFAEDDLVEDDLDDLAEDDPAEDDVAGDRVGEDDRDDANIEDDDQLDAGTVADQDDVSAGPPVETSAAEVAGGPAVDAGADSDASARGGSEPGAVTGSATDAAADEAGLAAPVEEAAVTADAAEEPGADAADEPAGPAEPVDAAGDGGGGAVHGAGELAADATGREALTGMEAVEEATEPAGAAPGPVSSDAGAADPPGTAAAGGRSFPALVFSSPETATPAVSQPADAPRPGSPIGAVLPDDPAGSDQGRP
jgi:tetratricopeptide (TPR) repeat protein